MNQLDLCGASGLAPFYLNMSRALDILLALPYADAQRVAVSGLSGGGWQTIVISALDPRVKLCNPVAGYSSFQGSEIQPSTGRCPARHHRFSGAGAQLEQRLAT